ncbi:MAG: hypothetical protein SPK03_07460 [Alloprevotella sp.]|nr:hypothetical protein [Alloprevotella sp.]
MPNYPIPIRPEATVCHTAALDFTKPAFEIPIPAFENSIPATENPKPGFETPLLRLAQSEVCAAVRVTFTQSQKMPPNAKIALFIGCFAPIRFLLPHSR